MNTVVCLTAMYVFAPLNLLPKLYMHETAFAFVCHRCIEIMQSCSQTQFIQREAVMRNGQKPAREWECDQ